MSLTGANVATTFAKLLKEYYQAPITDQINQQVWAIKYFEKRKQGWTGSQMILPVHISRNTGVGFSGEGAQLPQAGKQGYEKLVVQSKNMYGRIELTGNLMDTATGSNAGSFASAMTEEMDRLVQDVVNQENKAAIFGGSVIGVISERKGAVVAGSTVKELVGNDSTLSTADAASTFEYNGSFDFFDGTLAKAVSSSDLATYVKVRLFRSDTLAEIVPTVNADGTAAAIPNIYVSDFANNRTNPTITLRFGAENAVATSLSVNIGKANAPGIIVMLADSAGVNGQNPTVVNVSSGFKVLPSSLPSGLFDNLCNPTHFGVTRQDGGTAPILQSTVITHGTGDNGKREDADSDFSLERLQYVLDTLLHDSGTTPNVMLMSALMRHRYTVQLTGVLGTSSSNIRTGGDSGRLVENQDDLAYGGIKFEYDRHFPISTIAFINTEPWLFCELTSGQWADSDGNILSRVSNFDAYEAYWKHRYNMVCRRPNSQALLVGINPV